MSSTRVPEDAVEKIMELTDGGVDNGFRRVRTQHDDT